MSATASGTMPAIAMLSRLIGTGPGEMPARISWDGKPRSGRYMAEALLAVDGGLTVTKAVVFASDGRELGAGEVRVPQDTPRPRWVERDMDALWDACACAIQDALDRAGVAAADIAAVATTGHGDGIYLVDADGRSVRPAILSLDSRAHGIVEQWRVEGVLDEALRLTGQHPFAASPAPLLAWLKAHEPEVWTRCRWVLTCKDW